MDETLKFAELLFRLLTIKVGRPLSEVITVPIGFVGVPIKSLQEAGGPGQAVRADARVTASIVEPMI